MRRYHGDQVCPERQLAGSGGGDVLPGRRISYGEQTPVANLFIAMLANFGVLTDSFGEDGHEALPAL